MALMCSDVKKDDIVLCQDLTFIASVNPILYLNAIPVFVDSNMDTWNIDPKTLEIALQKYGTRVKAVIIVHLYGLACELDEIVSICNKYNVSLIEDAAESLGTTYKGKSVGTFGKMGVFSFNGNKIITTSGGGILVSNDKSITDRVLYLSSQAKEKALHYQHSDIGFNYRMSNIIAGIGRGQMKVLSNRINRKRTINDLYKKHLSNLPGVTMMPDNDWQQANCWLTCFLSYEIPPLIIIEELQRHNIESRPLWKPMHMQPLLRMYDYIGDGVSEELYKYGVCLPSDTKLTDEQVMQIIDIIQGVFGKYYE